MAAASNTRAFQLCLNPFTGESEWFVVNADYNEEVIEASSSPSSLLDSTSYLDVLNDAARNHAFRRAIEATITKLCHVLDIGENHSEMMLYDGSTSSNLQIPEKRLTRWSLLGSKHDEAAKLF